MMKYMNFYIFLLVIKNLHITYSFFDFFKSNSFKASDDNIINYIPDSNPVRGVPEYLHPYYLNEKFTCDNGIEYDSSIINDGYCDCQDKTDEPGTSACLGIAFHCINTGYKIIKIPSSRVDDQVCDCCDGSDEGILIKCPNTCKEASEKEKSQIEKVLNDYKLGSITRSDLIQRVTNEKTRLASSITPLGMEVNNVKDEIEDYHEKLGDLLLQKDTIEEAIKSEKRDILLKYLNLDSLNLIESAHIISNIHKLMNISIEELKKYITKEDKEIDNDDAHNNNNDTVTNESSIDSTLETTDEESYVDDDHNMLVNEEDDLNHDEVIDQDSSTSTNEHIKSNTDESISCNIVEVTNDYALLPLCDSIDNPESALSFIISLLLDRHSYHEILLILGYYRITQSFVDIEVLIKTHVEQYGMNTCPLAFEVLGLDYCNLNDIITKHIHNHSLHFEEPLRKIDNDIDTLRNLITKLEQKLKEIEHNQNLAKSAHEDYMHYINHLEYLAMKDQCFEVVDGAFKYKLCILNKVTQSELTGNKNEVLLGSFKSVDEKYDNGVSTVMNFDNGQYCHAFGERKASVDIICSSRNALISASEPSTCSYQLLFESPLACTSKYAQMVGISI